MVFAVLILDLDVLGDVLKFWHIASAKTTTDYIGSTLIEMFLVVTW